MASGKLTLTDVVSGLSKSGISRGRAVEFFAIAAGREADLADLACAAAVASGGPGRPDGSVGNLSTLKALACLRSL